MVATLMMVPGLRSCSCSCKRHATGPAVRAAIDGCGQAVGDLVGRAEPVDRHEQILGHVPGDEGLGLLVVEVEPLAYGLGRVVLALHDLATTDVTGPVVPGWRPNRVVGPAIDAHPTVRYAQEHDVLGHFEIDG